MLVPLATSPWIEKNAGVRSAAARSLAVSGTFDPRSVNSNEELTSTPRVFRWIV